MFLELHILQNFSPANLNRDDTGAPKDCHFGGYRRARISSQCIKRSVRKHPAFREAVLHNAGDLGVRTKRLVAKLKKLLHEEKGQDAETAGAIAHMVVELLGLKTAKGEKTQYLLYLGEKDILELAELAAQHAEDLHRKKAKDVPKEVSKAFKELLDKKKKKDAYAADIALFGRMIADDKDMNVDAACQVAQALSTNKVDMEMDYYTAVDDLLPDDQPGSDMIGVVEFNSSCFYRYACVDCVKLEENLAGDADLAGGVLQGFVEASVKAVPTGKQNSMAAQNPPSYVRVVLRKDGFPWSLANAFQDPAYPARGQSLETISTAKLQGYMSKLKKAYDVGGVVCDLVLDLTEAEKPADADSVSSLNELLESIPACYERGHS
jgi:CRISPR system Cascade subunit CasC